MVLDLFYAENGWSGTAQESNLSNAIASFLEITNDMPENYTSEALVFWEILTSQQANHCIGQL